MWHVFIGSHGITWHLNLAVLTWNTLIDANVALDLMILIWHIPCGANVARSHWCRHGTLTMTWYIPTDIPLVEMTSFVDVATNESMPTWQVDWPDDVAKHVTSVGWVTWLKFAGFTLWTGQVWTALARWCHALPYCLWFGSTIDDPWPAMRQHIRCQASSLANLLFFFQILWGLSRFSRASSFISLLHDPWSFTHYFVFFWIDSTLNCDEWKPCQKRLKFIMIYGQHKVT